MELLARSPGRHGAKPLKDLLEDFLYDECSREEFEALFFDFCVERDLPIPTMNSSIEGYTVDAHWPGTNLIVELDSRAFHLNPKAFEEDRTRDAALPLAGYRVVRITYRQLTREPEAVEQWLSRLLAGPQPAQPSPHSAAPSPAAALQP